MAYTVLARKYRSRTFDEVIGQAPIATTLVNAIQTGRVHHGYLFTGTRGVGKTSMARILAKALNCLRYEAPTTTPCGECDACRAIAEGQDIDVVEIDAASNTGVDNIRELRSNTAYRPARARFKVYIIDEVHMLSTGAFNALLKTLEEPPEHVKFILATTEVQKVPATIQSRCQRFNFRNIGPAEIAARLAFIVAQEGARAEEPVLRRVARLANGSMRDALSILDQLLSVCPQELTAAVLDEILPPAQDEQLLKLLQHAAAGEVAAVLADLEAVLNQGRGLENFCNDLIELVRTLMLIRACGVDASLVDVPAAAREEYAELSRRFELSQYVQIIAMLEELRRNVRYSGAGRALTDAVAVRLARMHAWTPIEQLLGQVSAESSAAEKKKPGPAEPAPGGISPGTPLAAGAAAERPAPPPAANLNAAPHPAAGRFVPTPPRPVAKAASGDAIPARAAVPAAVAAPVEGLEREAPLPAEPPPDLELDRPPADIYLEPAGGAPDAPVPGRTTITSADRAVLERDPLAQRIVDLFDAELVYVERRPAAPPAPETE